MELWLKMLRSQKMILMLLQRSGLMSLPLKQDIQHLMTHIPKRPDCLGCGFAKLANSPCRNWAKYDVVRPTKFGEVITADHFVAASLGDMSIKKHAYGLVVMDRGSRWIQCYPLKD